MFGSSSTPATAPGVDESLDVIFTDWTARSALVRSHLVVAQGAGAGWQRTLTDDLLAREEVGAVIRSTVVDGADLLFAEAGFHFPPS